MYDYNFGNIQKNLTPRQNTKRLKEIFIWQK